MAVVVTMLADHKGITAPKAVGDEYVVDALIDMDTYADGGLTVTAAQLGLRTVHCVAMTGQDSLIGFTVPEVDASGEYAGATSFKLNCIKGADGPNAEGGDVDYGSVRIRVWGNL